MTKRIIITCLRGTIGRWPKGKAIAIPVLALFAMAGQAKTFKTIKNPVAMACVNVSDGELKAREVIMRDTATTVHFTIEYEKGNNFRFAKESYLMDEDGNRYPLRSAGNSPRRMGAVARKRRNRLHDAFRAIAEEGTGIRLHRGRWLWGIQVVRHPRQEIQNQIPNDAGTRRR